MCGILIRLSKTKVDAGLLSLALENLSHRGPDNQGVNSFELNGIFYDLVHTRLSIRGLGHEADQPLVSDCGNYIICFNGEIYNTKYLCDKYDLTASPDASDTKVLLELIAKVGRYALVDLEGMFAFCFVDRMSERVYIIRDSVGIKPLYRFESDDSLIFCSEINPIRNLVDRSLSVDPVDVSEFLASGFVSEPHTGFTEIKKVIPGHCLTISQLEIEDEFRFAPARSSKKISADLIKAAINDQTISDVPVGVFFSGGTDSTAIAVETRLDLLHVNANPLDSKFSRKIAERLGSSLVVAELGGEGKENIFDHAQLIAQYVEEPISDYTFLASYILSKRAKALGFKVMLSGMGADEIFGGYSRYAAYDFYCRSHWLLRFIPKFVFIAIGKLPVFRGRRMQRLINALIADDHNLAYTSLVGYLSGSELRKLLGSRSDDLLSSLRERWSQIVPLDCSVRDVPRFLDARGFLSHNLTVADKSSMRAGIELRVPFLSEKLFFADKEFSKKTLLKLISVKLDLSFLKRKKEGFNPPLNNLINCHNINDYREFFSNCGIYSWLSEDAVLDILNDHFSKKYDNTYKIWQLVFFSAWLKCWG